MNFTILLSSSKPPLQKPAENLTLNDVNFILGVALESLKTTQNALNLLKDINPGLPYLLEQTLKSALTKNDMSYHGASCFPFLTKSKGKPFKLYTLQGLINS